MIGLTAAALLWAGLFFGLLALGISPHPADLIIEVENRTGSTVEVAFEGVPRTVLKPGDSPRSGA